MHTALNNLTSSFEFFKQGHDASISNRIHSILGDGTRTLHFRPYITKVNTPNCLWDPHGTISTSIINYDWNDVIFSPLPSHYIFLILGPNLLAIVFIKKDQIESTRLGVDTLKYFFEIKCKKHCLLIIVIESDHIFLLKLRIRHFN